MVGILNEETARERTALSLTTAVIVSGSLWLSLCTRPPSRQFLSPKAVTIPILQMMKLRQRVTKLPRKDCLYVM